MNESQFDGEIRDLSQAGLGVVNGADGRVYFVTGAWPGDVGTFEILSQKKSYGFAKIVKLTQKSIHRIEKSLCKFHGIEDGACGGCPWIDFDYADQVKRKDSLIKTALERAKVLEPTTALNPMIASEKSVGYRNRAQFKTDGTRLGFISFQNKTLVDVNKCAVLNEECSQRLEDLRKRLPNQYWKPNDSYLWNFIEINDTQEWNPAKITTNTRLPFAQGNHAQNQVMQKWLATQVAKLSKNQRVIELFCGSGNFTKVLVDSPNVSAVAAIEISDAAILELNNKRLPKTKTLAANVLIPSTWKRIRKLEHKPTVLFLDPAREGFEGIDGFLKQFTSITDVIYISCSLNTFARDCTKLLKMGFKANLIQPVDMFPNTPHIELCATFSKS